MRTLQATTGVTSMASQRRHCHAGFTLIEVMIAMAIGLIILGAMSMVFVNSHSARGQIEKTSRLTENGRYALQILADDVRLAGFYGETVITAVSPVTPGAPANANDYVCVASAATLVSLMPIHVYGIHNVANSARPACIPETVKDGTDVLVIRRVTTTTIDAATAAGTTGKFYFQASLCNNDASTYTLNDTGPWNLKLKNCTTNALVREVVTRIYYVAANNAAGDGIPTLKRVQMVGNTWTSPEVLGIADGVEEFQLEYGIDSAGGDGVPDAYASQPADMSAWRNAVTMKVSMLLRSADKTLGYSDSGMTYTVGPKAVTGTGDGYRRHVFSANIEMTNALGRREL